MRADNRDGDRVRSAEVTPEGGGTFRVSVDGVEIRLEAQRLDDGRLRLAGAGGVVVAEVTAAGTRRFVRLGNLDFVLERAGGGRRAGGAAPGGGLEAPMPGVVTRVLAEPGETVRKGQPLVAVEAMKMEHLIRAPRDGRVARVLARAGEMVDGGEALVEMEETAPET